MDPASWRHVTTGALSWRSSVYCHCDYQENQAESAEHGAYDVGVLPFVTNTFPVVFAGGCRSVSLHRIETDESAAESGEIVLLHPKLVQWVRQDPISRMHRHQGDERHHRPRE